MATNKREKDCERLFDFSIDLLSITGTDGYFKHVNPAFEKTLGYSLDEIFKKPFIEFVHPDDKDSTLAEVEKLATGVPTINFENRFQCKDGSYKYLSWNAFPAPEEGMMYSIARDVTEQKKVEDALKDSEEKTLAILNTAVDGIITLNEDRIITSFNPAAEKLFRYSKEEVIGQNVKMLMPEPYRNNHDKYVKNFLKTGKKKIIGIGREVVGRRKDGTTFPMYLSVGETRVGDQRFFTGILHDITDIKHAEEEIRKYASELEEKIKQLEEKGVSRYDSLIKKKNSYLIKEKGQGKSLAIFWNLTKHGLTGLCLTTKHPDVLNETYELDFKGLKTEIIWLSASGSDEATINPSNLTAIHGKVNEFTKNNEDSVVHLLGLEYIVTLSGFEKSLKFLNSLFDTIILNNSRLIIGIDPETLNSRELSLLENALIEIKDDELIHLGLK